MLLLPQQPRLGGDCCTRSCVQRGGFSCSTTPYRSHPSFPTFCLLHFWPGFTLQLSGMSIIHPVVQARDPDVICESLLSLSTPTLSPRVRTASAPSHTLLCSPVLLSGPACLVQVLMAMILHWSPHHASVMFSSLLPV